jgi:hypothetical protein
MAQVNSYRDLLVCQKATARVTEVYSLPQPFPPAETYGLTSQVRRSVVLFPAPSLKATGDDLRPITKIFADGDRLPFELQAQVETARNLHYITKEIFKPFFKKTQQPDKLLYFLITKIN